MWTPAGTHSTRQMADIAAMQAAMLLKLAVVNQDMVRLRAELKKANDLAVELQNILDGRPG